MTEWKLFAGALALCVLVIVCCVLNVWLAVQLYLARNYPKDEFDPLLGGGG
jgi:hypothetical protein